MVALINSTTRGRRLAHLGWALAIPACGPTVPDASGSSSGGGEVDSTGLDATTPMTTGSTVDGEASEEESSSGRPDGECAPGDAEPCYEGAAGTESVGACRAGTRSCDPSGQWTECLDQVVPAPERCTTDADEDCDGGVTCEPVLEWSHSFGGVVQVMAVGPDGTVAISGQGRVDATLGGESIRDLFFATIASDGTVGWARSVQELNDQTTTAMEVHMDGSVTAVGPYLSTPDFGGGPLPNGFSGSRTFVVRYGPDGAYQWSRSLPLSSVQMVEAENGGSVLLGWASEGTDIEGTTYGPSFVLFELTSVGEVDWVTEIQGDSFQAFDLVGTDEGTILVAAWAASTVTIGDVSLKIPAPARLSTWTFDTAGALLDPRISDFVEDGELRVLHAAAERLVLLGRFPDPVDPETFYSLQRFEFDADLQQVASEVLAPSADVLSSHEALDDGVLLALDLGPDDAIVAGSDVMTFDQVLLREDGTGVPLWLMGYTVPWGGSVLNGPGPALEGPFGAVYVTGAAQRSSQVGGQDVADGFLVKLDPG